MKANDQELERLIAEYRAVWMERHALFERYEEAATRQAFMLDPAIDHLARCIADVVANVRSSNDKKQSRRKKVDKT